MKRLLFAIFALAVIWWGVSIGRKVMSPVTSFPIPTNSVTAEVLADLKNHGWEALVVSEHTNLQQPSWECLANLVRHSGPDNKIELSREIYRVEGGNGKVTKMHWEYPPLVKTTEFKRLMDDWWKAGHPEANTSGEAKPTPAKP